MDSQSALQGAATNAQKAHAGQIQLPDLPSLLAYLHLFFLGSTGVEPRSSLSYIQPILFYFILFYFYYEAGFP